MMNRIRRWFKNGVFQIKTLVFILNNKNFSFHWLKVYI
ncbi:hypothetical protein ELI_0722 [Eubacterium callanderi]|uniref:Uncharacterized protein n=1 Tax=Eubacterium callanderi TaxID=53442 RepID=E3GJA1_9FIRM|nr:hypothetical protein ELI_0722 [Eubacterium callanderi]